MFLLSIILFGVLSLSFTAALFAAILFLPSSEGFSIFLLFPACILGLLVAVPVGGQIRDLTTISTAERFIEVEKNALDGIEAEINKISAINGSIGILNADNPVGAYISEKSDRIDAIRAIKRSVEDARLSILRREMGVVQWGTWLVKDINQKGTK